MQIEEGKYYKSMSGAKIGPMIATDRYFKDPHRPGTRWNPAGVPINCGDWATSVYTLVTEWTEEIEWGDWGDLVPGDRRRCGDYQVQRIDGVKQIRFPKPKVQTLIGRVHIEGHTRSVEVTFVDGKPQWSTLKVTE